MKSKNKKILISTLILILAVVSRIHLKLLALDVVHAKLIYKVSIDINRCFLFCLEDGQLCWPGIRRRRNSSARVHQGTESWNPEETKYWSECRVGLLFEYNWCYRKEKTRSIGRKCKIL